VNRIGIGLVGSWIPYNCSVDYEEGTWTPAVQLPA